MGRLLSLTQFHKAYEAAHYSLDQEKKAVVDAPASGALHVVAGPGTGKTTAVVARILKLMFVDGVPPAGIVATTFTKKAANELRSRILEVGYPLQECLQAFDLSTEVATAVAEIDINQLWTGTTDSLCQELLTLYRPAGTQPPVLVEPYVADAIMLQAGIWGDGRWRSEKLKTILGEATGGSNWYPTSMNKALSTIADRVVHDRIDWPQYLRRGSSDLREPKKRLQAAVEAYETELEERGRVDYARLELRTLEWLREGHLNEFLGTLQAVFVDEYQDTNLLQEQLYLELAKGCGGAITVVGDDDQSLYRFRGATVELFTRFPARAGEEGIEVARFNLVTNYRSSKTIVNFVDGYARLDPGYQQARAKKKPRLRAAPGAGDGMPVLAMFRDHPSHLADDLADLIRQVFRGDGFEVPSYGRIRAGDGGDVGDAALLSFSPREGSPNRRQLPGALRERLEGGPDPIQVFNPRGRALAEYETIQVLGGLILRCLDPKGAVAAETYGAHKVEANRKALDQWREKADHLSQRNPTLRDYVRSWQTRVRSRTWPAEIPAIDLIYDLAHHVKGLMDDPEGQLHLEAVTRQLSAVEQVSGFGGRVLHRHDESPEDGGIAARSVQHLIDKLIVPLVSGGVELNDELIDEFPHDRFSVLSIHQSKGLEFPLVIADVGSRLASQKSSPPQRFPDSGEESHRMEDHFRVASPLGPPRRSAVDRAFDDLYRRFFVAFSRARNVLVLVGRSGTRPGGVIPNVATGWDRMGNCKWAGTQPPFVEI